MRAERPTGLGAPAPVGGDDAQIKQLAQERALKIGPVGEGERAGEVCRIALGTDREGPGQLDELAPSGLDLLGRRFGVGWGNRLERQMLDFVPVVVAAGGTVGEAVDHILATKLLRKVRDRHDTRPEDLTALSERIAEAWPKLDKTTGAVRSMAIVRDELRRLGAEEEA